jgi:hypothetical protein
MDIKGWYNRIMAISYPPVFINQYLAEKVVEAIPERFASSFKFFPVSPTDITALTEGFPDAASDVFAVYDRMFRYRKSPFPHIKNEQVIYYLYKNGSDPEALIEATQIIYDLLDRMDESAIELNEWISSKIGIDGLVSFGSGNLRRTFKPVFFHDLKVYQLEEVKHVINFSTARPYAGNKIIIDYEYHNSDVV